jgi:hypothetical protein
MSKNNINGYKFTLDPNWRTEDGNISEQIFSSIEVNEISANDNVKLNNSRKIRDSQFVGFEKYLINMDNLDFDQSYNKKNLNSRMATI